MAVTEISQIQLRRGPLTDLQANATSSGEVGFASDTGQLFIGTDPNYSGFWTTRAVSPYNSVEILTEAGTGTFGRLFDEMNRTLGPFGTSEGFTNRKPYLQAILYPESSFTPVMISSLDPATGLYTGQVEELNLANDATVVSSLDYSVTDGTNMIMGGTLTILHNGNGTTNLGQCVNDYNIYTSATGNGSVFTLSSFLVSNIKFRANRVSSPTTHLRLEYENLSSGNLTLYIKGITFTPTLT